jgi:hypothetical protein
MARSVCGARRPPFSFDMEITNRAPRCRDDFDQQSVGTPPDDGPRLIQRAQLSSGTSHVGERVNLEGVYSVLAWVEHHRARAGVLGTR